MIPLPNDVSEFAQGQRRLLVLDPFVRLHRRDENVAGEVAPLLAYLRQLERERGVAVLLVHQENVCCCIHFNTAAAEEFLLERPQYSINSQLLEEQHRVRMLVLFGSLPPGIDGELFWGALFKAVIGPGS